MSPRRLLGLLLAVFLALALEPPLEAATRLQRYPYLQPVGATRAGVSWVTSRPGRGWVEYGPTEGLGSRQETSGRAGTWHHAVLTGLEPGTRVYYRVGVDSEPLSTVYSFRTAAPPGTPFAFAAVGDVGAGNAPQRDLAARIAEDAPEFVVIPGDVVYDRGAEWEFKVRFFEPLKSLLVRTPFFPALGNHDVLTRGGAPYLETFHLPHNERWYSFDWGDVHFTALDSTSAFGPGTPQDEWLDGDLAASEAPWKVVFFHHPPYSASPAHGSSLGLRKAWSPLFERRGVQLVLNGHNHRYERTRPIRGVTYVVTGGGGAHLYPTGDEPWLESTASRHHYLRMKASPESLSWEAVGRDGEVFDRHEIQGRGSAAPAP